MASVAERHETYAGAFDAFRRQESFGPEWLRSAREDAFSRFLDRGFPTTRNEDWAFTNVAPIAQAAFAPLAADAPATAGALTALDRVQLGDTVAPPIVILNGRRRDGQPALPAGVTVRGVRQSSDLPGLGHPTRTVNAFVNLNTAFFDDAVVLEIAPHTVVSQPIHVAFVAAAQGRATMVAPRLVVLAGEAAQVSLVESYVSDGSGVFTSAVTDIVLGPSAIVDHVKLQDESTEAFHLASLFVTLARASTFTSHAITIGGQIARNDIVATLDGEGAECTLNGLYVAGGDSLVDTHTTIDHAQPHCPSHEVYKGILSGRARAVFNGKIIVRQDAQKTDAKQTNKALLLTDDAQINTKPQLEIFADDVKCTHGAAIGQLDEDAMFYLRARGISEGDARNLLIHAFAGEVVDGLKTAAVRDWAMRAIDEKLSLPHMSL
jgi:Fe-S cluster assembly protein SufD